MVWIFVVITAAIAWVFIKFLMDFNRQRNIIAAKGGIKAIYKPLIDGLLEYRSARIIQDKKDFVTIEEHSLTLFLIGSVAYGLSSYSQHSKC